MSEAVEAVSHMLTAYPNATGLTSGYIGTVASLLMQYPAGIARRCADPVHGIATLSKFPPTIAELSQWLEKAKQPLEKAVEWDKQTAEQLRERAEVEAQEKAEPLEHRRKVAERILREYREALSNSTGEANVFVPSFAPQYRDMIERGRNEPGAHYGVSLEDNRSGVWVPLEWLRSNRGLDKTWRRFTDEELLALYPKKSEAAE